MKNRTKISLLLLALTLSMSVSANSQASESIFSKKVIHSVVKQNINVTLDALLDDFKVPDQRPESVQPIIRNAKINRIEIDERSNEQEVETKIKEIS